MYAFFPEIGDKEMNNKRGGVGAKILIVLILMLASAGAGAYGYSILDGKLAVRDANKDIEMIRVSDYDTAEQTVIQGFVDEAKRNLETAKTRKEVYDVISEFIADVDKVQTANEKKLEEALRAAEEAKQKYGNGNNSNNNNNSNSNSNNSNNNSYNSNNNNQNDDLSYDNDTSSNNSGNYKSNELNNSNDTEEEKGGFLNSLIGGLANGSDGN